MTLKTQRFMRQLCAATGGRHSDGVIDYFVVGRQAGLTEEETEAAVHELAWDRYVTHGTVSRAVFLTDEGAFCCRRGQWGDNLTEAADA